MKFILKLLAMAVVGVILGQFGMTAALKVRAYFALITNGDCWVTAKGIGSRDADPMLKAIIASIGIFANSREEAIYLQAFRDSPIAKLKGERHYQIKGNIGIPARWWSITLYNEDDFLFDNPDRRYSYTNFNLAADDSGEFTIDVAPVRPPGSKNWLPSPSSGDISMTLRIYEPAEQLYRNLETYPLPTVKELM